MKDYFETKITKKYQIHLPNEVCDLLQLKEGEQVTFTKKTAYTFGLKNRRNRLVPDYEIVCESSVSSNNRILIPKSIRSSLARTGSGSLVIRIIDDEVIIAEKQITTECEKKQRLEVYIDDKGITALANVIQSVDIDTDARCQEPLFDILNINFVDSVYKGYGERNGKDVYFKIFKRTVHTFMGVPVVANINYYYEPKYAFMTQPPEVPFLSNDKKDIDGCSKLLRTYKLLNAFFSIKGQNENIKKAIEKAIEKEEPVYITAKQSEIPVFIFNKDDIPNCYAENVLGLYERIRIADKDLLDEILLRICSINYFRENDTEEEIHLKRKQELYKAVAGTEYDTPEWKEMIEELLKRKEGE